jgi:hypothetical protein
MMTPLRMLFFAKKCTILKQLTLKRVFELIFVSSVTEI